MMNTPMYSQPQPDSESAYELFQRAHPGRGSLRVQASTARGSFPVPGALVEVTRNFNGVTRVLYKNNTNNSGIVERMILPTLPSDYSRQEATAEDSGTVYQVSVYHPGFVPLIAKCCKERVATRLCFARTFTSPASLSILNQHGASKWISYAAR